MLTQGDIVPHFEVTSIEGVFVKYASVWQRRHLVLIVLPVTEPESFAAYASDLLAQRPRFDAHQTECVVTRDPVTGLTAPAALVADRWGEIAYLVEHVRASELPTPDELLDWIEHVQNRCPECEGESK